MFYRCESGLKNVFMVAGIAVIGVGIIGSIAMTVMLHASVFFAFYGILSSLALGGILFFAYEVLDILETMNNNIVQLGNNLTEKKD